MAKVKLPARTIRNQGDDVNCCTSCALAACLEALRKDFEEVSPLFHYHLSGGQAGNRGLTDNVALSGARIHGFCLQPLHPHPISITGLRRVPTQRAVEDADGRRLYDRRYPRLWSWVGSTHRERAWKKALDAGHPLFLAIATDAPYWDLKQDGVTVWEPSSAPPGTDGDHAVAVLGYDDGPGHFIIQDSRGTNFGVGGQWFLSYRACQRTQRITAAYEIGR